MTTHPDITHNDTTTITMSGGSVARLLEVLQICDQFLRSDGIRDDLITFCHRHPTLTAGWLIDMVGLHAYHLRTRLEEAGVRPLPRLDQDLR